MRALMAPSAARKAQAGNSVVEFAVVAPVLVMLVLYATYFHDGVRTKLKVQEAARFGAWEFTSLPMSDFFEGNHDTLFADAQQRIVKDLKVKYATFDSSRPDTALSETFIAKHTLLVDDAHLSPTNSKVELVDNQALSSVPGVGGALGGLGGLGNQGLDLLESLFKFNSKGLVSFEVTGRFENRILPQAFQDDRFKEKMTPTSLASFEMSDHVALIVDGWTLHNGQDSNLASGRTGGTEIAGKAGPHPFGAQVSRIQFLGIPGLIPDSVKTVATKIEQYFPLEFQDPLYLEGTPVASLNYRNAKSTDDWSCRGTSPDAPGHGEESLQKHGRHIDVGLDCFQTAPVRVTRVYNDSPLMKILHDSGKFYMRCNQEQASNPVSCAQ
jgi:hypothetical protein